MTDPSLVTGKSIALQIAGNVGGELSARAILELDSGLLQQNEHAPGRDLRRGDRFSVSRDSGDVDEEDQTCDRSTAESQVQMPLDVVADGQGVPFAPDLSHLTDKN